MLPTPLWKPSPNFSARTARLDLVVVHDCQGSYAGAIETFLGQNNGNPVSAHFVIREDGAEITQMVEVADKAWACCDFNSRSANIEMAGWAAKGYPSAEWQAMADLVAALLHDHQIPLRWARAGVGPGFCSHFDLGAAGGGHTDPTTDPAVWQQFIARVTASYARGDMPAVYGR